MFYPIWDVASGTRACTLSKQKVESSNLSEGIFLLNFVKNYIDLIRT